MAKQDYYATLGVAKNASADDLKKAYRKLAMQYHPDRNPGDKQAEVRFKEGNEAYDVLKDDQKRSAYDRFGHAAFEGVSGTKVPLRVPTRVKCETCDGTGSQDKGRAAETCPTCQGSGKVRRQSGFFLIEQTCATCGGQGRVVRNPCRICQGAGAVQRERSLSVPIPAGVEDGTRIRLSGE